MLIAPPAPLAVVLLSSCPPLTLMLPTFAVMVPALPAPVVLVEILAPSATVALLPDTVIWPAFPVFDAVLKSPVPAPDAEALDAFSTIAPPAPALLVLLLIVPPLVMFKLLRFIATLPAAPPVVVATEIVP